MFSKLYKMYGITLIALTLSSYYDIQAAPEKSFPIKIYSDTRIAFLNKGKGVTCSYVPSNKEVICLSENKPSTMCHYREVKFLTGKPKESVDTFYYIGTVEYGTDNIQNVYVNALTDKVFCTRF